MTHKGFEIVQQWKNYEIWELDEKGRIWGLLTDYEAEPDVYMVWDTENNWQHEEFPEAFDSIADAKAAINKHLKGNL